MAGAEGSFLAKKVAHGRERVKGEISGIWPKSQEMKNRPERLMLASNHRNPRFFAGYLYFFGRFLAISLEF